MRSAPIKNKICILTFLQISSFFLLKSSALFGDPQSTTHDKSQQEINLYLDILSKINRPVLSTGAGSHGSFGTFVGIGMSNYTLSPENSTVINENLNKQNVSNRKDQLTSHRIYLTKGFPIPLDLSMSYSKVNETVNQFSLCTQWTFFEDFSMPALAVRSGYSTLNATNHSTISSINASINASYSFLRYFTIFGEKTYYEHKILIKPDTNKPKTYQSLSTLTGFNNTDLKKRWSNSSFSYGLELQLFSSPISTSFQREHDNSNIYVDTLKLTIMI